MQSETPKSLRGRLYQALFPLAKLYFRVFRPKTTGATVILERDGQVLLVRNTYGTQYWGWPGGGVGRGEAPAVAAAREVQEELSLTVQDLTPVSCFPFTHHYRNDTVHLFAGTVDQSEPQVDPAEILEARWFPVKQVADLPLTTVGAQCWQIYQDHRRQP